MKQMKKNDGYVLVYVLAVFVVLSLAAVTICTSAVKNLRSQQASIERTQALYQAQGQMEHFLALMDRMEAAAPVSGGSETDAKDKAREAFWHDLRALDEILEYISVDFERSTLERLVVQGVNGENGAAKIDAELQVFLELEVAEITSGDPMSPIISYTCSYAMSQGAVYRSYDISYSKGGDAG